MATTGFQTAASDLHPTAHQHVKSEKDVSDQTPMGRGVDDEAAPNSLRDSVSLKPVYDSTHRKLKPRHVSLIGIGGTIGEWACNKDRGFVSGEGFLGERDSILEVSVENGS